MIVYKWGCQILVHDFMGPKIHAHAREGHWVGIGKESDGHCVYWPDHQSVTIKHNVYFPPTNVFLPGSTVLHEGLSDIMSLEGEHSSESNPYALQGVTDGYRDISSDINTPPILPPCPSSPSTHASPDVSLPTACLIKWLCHVWKPGHYIHNILKKKGTPTDLGGPVQPPGVHMSGDMSIAFPDCLDPVADDRLVYAMATVMADIEKLELETITEAYICPDWPKWSKAIDKELK